MPSRRSLAQLALALLTFASAAAAASILLDSKKSPWETSHIVPLPNGASPQALRLTALETGIAAVSASQLEAAQLGYEEFSAAGLSLTRDGRPVPFYVRGRGKDASLYFYAQAITDTLAAPAVYWLMAGEGSAMPERTERPGSELARTGRLSYTWEENEIYLAQAGGDVWLGELLFAPSTLEQPLEHLRPNGGPGRLSVRIWSNNQAHNADPDHHLVLSLNGRRLADHFWDGIREETITADVPAGALTAEGNTLTIAAPGDTGAAGEALYLDWVRLEYEGELAMNEGELTFDGNAAAFLVTNANDGALIFDVADPQQPVVILGGQMVRRGLAFAGRAGARPYALVAPGHTTPLAISLVPEREPLRADGRGADYVAIVADEPGFAETLEPLLALRGEQGMQVELVSAQHVFDEFGFGRQTPEAIRDFLAFASNGWRPAPRFALLVGDASYDLHDFNGGPNRNLLPTHLIYTEFAGYVASDTWFSIFDAGSLRPEIAIGRLPAQSAGQLAEMVAKTIAYERAAAGPWQAQALLVADDEPTFDQASNNLAAELARAGFQAEKLYISQGGNVHEPLMGALNRGAGILNYVGHGSIEVWGDEKVFQVEDAGRLINGDRLPIFTTFTCLNGYFNHPAVDALAESLLAAEKGGVVAAVAPSGRSLTSQQFPLAEEFFRLLLSGRAQTVGEALLGAKTAAAGDPFLEDVIHTFNLLGDPALRFRLPA
ncbi:MAG: C25 family cysteine peptidase [Candidatus Promineifilaceae bacterium]